MLELEDPGSNIYSHRQANTSQGLGLQQSFVHPVIHSTPISLHACPLGESCEWKSPLLSGPGILQSVVQGYRRWTCLQNGVLGPEPLLMFIVRRPPLLPPRARLAETLQKSLRMSCSPGDLPPPHWPCLSVQVVLEIHCPACAVGGRELELGYAPFIDGPS